MRHKDGEHGKDAMKDDGTMAGTEAVQGTGTEGWGGQGGFDGRSGTLSGGWTESGDGQVVLGGRYRVVRRLGEGGMGSVWLAEDSMLDGRKVAVKMLPAVLAGKKGACRQVKQEALVAMKLAHPNIATVRAFEEEEGGAPFLVMDYIDGETLEEVLAEKGPLGEEETVRLLGPVAAALDYAHGKGVVHRDVKPENVMVAKDGTPCVLDFGIAREIQETMTRMTGKLSSGTLLYMSPEQLRGRAPQAAQDVYSFAAMAYECLTGAPPFSRGQVEWQIMNEPPAPLAEGVAGAVLREGVMAGLAKEPEGRPGSCAEVLGTGKSRSRPSGLDGQKKGEMMHGFMMAVNVVAVAVITAFAAVYLFGFTSGLFNSLSAGYTAGILVACAGLFAIGCMIAKGICRAFGGKEGPEGRPGSCTEVLGTGENRRNARKSLGKRTAGMRPPAWTWLPAVALLAAAIGAGVRWGAGRAAPKEAGESVVADAPAGPEAVPNEGGMPAAPAETRQEAGAPEGVPPEAGEPETPAGTTKTIALPQGGGLEMVWCPGIGEGIWMGKYEVSQAQWESVMGRNPSHCKGPDLPVESVSWNDCMEFVEKLNSMPGIHSSGLVFRLPTDAEWTAACRAGTPMDAKFHNLADGTPITKGNLDRVAWSGEDWNTGSTHPVGWKEPNAWGLHDMFGNVWEWTQTAVGDQFSSHGSGAFNPAEDYGGWRSVNLERPEHACRNHGLRLAADGRTAGK